ncbi:MAG: DUF4097 family beta strand repeat-containing protein [Candidatus Zixiibacteriota bacterium]
MKTKPILWLIPVMFLFFAGAAPADTDREYGEVAVDETFSDIEIVRLNTVSGDCELSPAKDDRVSLEVISSYRPRDNFEAIYRVKGKTLILKEEFEGSTRGNANWKLAIPPGTKIKFSTASGNFEAEDMTTDIDVETASGDIELIQCEGAFEIETASGNITLDNCRGEIDIETASGDIDTRDCYGRLDLGTASGDVELDGCTGEFSAGTASGDIDARDIIIEDASTFDAASGDVYVLLAKTPEHDLQLSTASGRAVLDYNGHPLKGFFEFTARLKNGDIDAPYKFEHTEEIERHDQEYIRKSFTLDSDTPEIIMETASGRVSLEK